MLTGSAKESVPRPSWVSEVEVYLVSELDVGSELESSLVLELDEGSELGWEFELELEGWSMFEVRQRIDVDKCRKRSKKDCKWPTYQYRRSSMQKPSQTRRRQ